MGKKKKVGRDRLDKFYHLAKDHGYRSRAAFKLIQLNKKFNFLAKSHVLIDLCAAPGSWLQVATKFMPVSRTIIGIDLHPIKPIPNVITLVQDIRTFKCRDELELNLKGSKADTVLHDGAPNVGGTWDKDAYSQNELTLSALKLAVEFLNYGGTFVTKIFRSIDYNTILWVLNQLFTKVSATKPSASRSTSAEIFVVCEKFLAPKKIDPRLLDPKVVFKPLKKEGPISLFKIKKKVNREGYDTDSILLFKKCSILKFINTEEPTKILAEHNSIVFEVVNPEEDDAEEIALYEEHPDSTDEIKECLKDLKVLNAKDFKLLLKWRMTMRRFGSLEEKPEPPKPVELTEEQKYNLMQQEIDDKIRKDDKRRKRKMRARLSRIQKMRLKLGINNNLIDDEFEAPTEEGLFNISSIRKGKQLSSLLENGKMDRDLRIVRHSRIAERKEKQKQKEVDFASELDSFSDYDRVHELKTEKYLDLMYENFIKDHLAFRKKLSARSRREKTRIAIPEDLTDFDKYVKMKDLEESMIETYEDDVIDNPLLYEDISQKVSKQAAVWFDNEIFDEEDDLDGDNGSRPFNKRKMDENDLLSEIPNSKKPKLNEEISSQSAVTTPSIDENAPFQEVAAQGVNSDEELSAEYYDNEDKAEILALGKLMQAPTSRHEVIESTSNRYMFPDDGRLVPEWFKDDERKHNKPIMPITKEMVEKYKEELKTINSRSTKKVAEAKARKRKHYLDKLQKARQKAKAIASSDITEKEKVKQIQKLYKGKLSKVKPQKVYVVGKRRVATKNSLRGNVRMKLVDTRLKKDKRARRAIEQRDGTRKRKRAPPKTNTKKNKK